MAGVVPAEPKIILQSNFPVPASITAGYTELCSLGLKLHTVHKYAPAKTSTRSIAALRSAGIDSGSRPSNQSNCCMRYCGCNLQSDHPTCRAGVVHLYGMMQQNAQSLVMNSRVACCHSAREMRCNLHRWPHSLPASEACLMYADSTADSTLCRPRLSGCCLCLS